MTGVGASRPPAGRGQIVAAVGEVGAGKSRLMYEFKATIPDECKVLEAYLVSHGASAWLPVIEPITSGGDLYDGSGATAVKADIAISRDKIAAVGNLEWMGHRGRR